MQDKGQYVLLGWGFPGSLATWQWVLHWPVPHAEVCVSTSPGMEAQGGTETEESPVPWASIWKPVLACASAWTRVDTGPGIEGWGIRDSLTPVLPYARMHADWRFRWRLGSAWSLCGGTRSWGLPGSRATLLPHAGVHTDPCLCLKHRLVQVPTRRRGAVWELGNSWDPMSLCMLEPALSPTLTQRHLSCSRWHFHKKYLVHAFLFWIDKHIQTLV